MIATLKTFAQPSIPLQPHRRVFLAIIFGVLGTGLLMAGDLDVQYLGVVGGGPRPYGVAVSGNFAYVAAGDEGFQVFDLRTQTNSKVGGCNTRGYALRVALAGNYAYVAEGQRYTGANYIGGGLEVIDVSDPLHPHRVGEMTNSVLGRIAVSGTYAYVADAASLWDGTNYVVRGGLQVIDISDPASPRRVGRFDTAPSANLAAVGNFVYVADREAGLQIIDVSNPTSPRRVGNYHGSREVVDVAVRGKYAYLAEAPLWDGRNYVGPGGLRVIDIGSPTNPVPVGGYHQGDATYVQSISVDGDYACLFAVGLFDIRDPSNPKFVAALRSPNDDLDQAVISGNFVYVPDYAAGLHVFDIRSPANPQRIASYEENGAWYRSSGHQAAVSGDYAYLLVDEYWNSTGKRIRNSLQVIDLSIPAAPRRVNDSDLSELDIRNAATALAAGENYAYVTGYALGGDGARPGGGLQIIDVSDRANPRLLSVWNAGWDTTALAVSGRYAYVGLKGLAVVDVGDPAAPQQVGVYNISNALVLHLTVSAGVAYMADWDAGMHLMDVRDPTNPRRVGGYRVGRVYGVAVSDNYAYLAEESRGEGANSVGGGLVVLDVRDPTAPRKIGGYGIGGFFSAVAVSGNYAYVQEPGSAGGLHVIDISDPAHPRRAGGNSAVTVSTIAISEGRLFTTAADGHGLAILDLFRPLRLAPLRTLASRPFRFHADGPRGVSLRLQRSGDLTDWQDWQAITAGAEPVEVSDPDATIAPRRFYRAVSP
jgi:hypothetical protein